MEQLPPQPQKTQGDCLREKRNELGLNQQEVAEKGGVSLKTYQRWERNEITTRGYNRKKLSTVLKIEEKKIAWRVGVGKKPTDPSSDPVKPLLKKRWSKRVKEVVLRPQVIIPIALVMILALILVIGKGFSSSGHPQSSLSFSQTPSAQPSASNVRWYPVMQQERPDCQNTPGNVWSKMADDPTRTNITCKDTGLTISQQGGFYAEVDLLKVHGQFYNQTTFRVQVQITFQRPDDPSTFAALVVQTPTAPNTPGGYSFILYPTAQCQLQQALSPYTLPVRKQGTLAVNPPQPILLTVEVSNGMLSGSINGSMVLTRYPDSLQPAPETGVGLLVGQPGAQISSSVLFSSFELDQART